MKQLSFLLLLLMSSQASYCWGFYGHRKINEMAIFLLPPKMMVFYKHHRNYLIEHAVDPDKRRYAIPEEGPRHYIDLDHYGNDPFEALPRRWEEAKTRFCEDSLLQHGIVPWWIQTMLARLTHAFEQQEAGAILKLSAEIGHYIADAHVPLHTSSNHNGQKTGQHGIHGFWESRIPEQSAESSWNFWIGKAAYIKDPLDRTWSVLLESAHAVDSVLNIEKKLSQQFPPDQKYAFEQRNGLLVKQYAAAYTTAYEQQLNHMVERRMRQAIQTVASFWFTAWVNAGQPDLSCLQRVEPDPESLQQMDVLQRSWKEHAIIGRACDEE